jgi:hypothetical protein
VKPEEDRGEPRAENVASQLQPKTCKDKLFLFFWVGGFLGGLWMSLQSVGHLLQFNINNLMITSIVFMLMSLNFVAKAPTIDRQIAYASLAVIPIAIRWALNQPSVAGVGNASLFDFSTLQQILYTLQVVSLWMLVAVNEECFRAAMMNVFDAFASNRISNPLTRDTIKLTTANLLWLLFHFIQRPFDPTVYGYYMLWLILSGMVMSFALLKGGLGAAVTLHFIVNMTA